MFYSQFILAKKGPLGTIWIAAHLERKLRKNQVADTDIGVSVDSILFPDVPIALRLSSHLLLGVVRIYNRKVNYLFDDCSEALLKLKQAFRSTAVDLPPEESKAPYHSITLPETFDLDDFELPDNDIFQGNCVDHHISSREQITLQDNMEGVIYSTSQFGLDERFGDGDTSGLDLDEELLMGKVDAAGHSGLSADPQASVHSLTLIKQEEHDEEMPGNIDTQNAVVNRDEDLMDYAQAPSTPGLIEEPNLSNVQETSACDDHMESEDNHLTESAVKNLENTSSKLDHQQGNDHTVHWSMPDDTASDAAPCMPCEENGYHSNNLGIPTEATIEHISSDDHGAVCGRLFVAEVGVLGEEPKLVYKSDGADMSHEDHGELIEVISGGSAEGASGLVEKSNNVENAESFERLSSPRDQLEFGAEFQDTSGLENPESRTREEPKDSQIANLILHDEIPCNQVQILRPCNADLGDSAHTGAEHSIDLEPSDKAAAQPETSERVEILQTSGASTVVQGEKCNSVDDSERLLKENHMIEPASLEDIHGGSGKIDDQGNNVVQGDSPLDNGISSVGFDFPAPEMMLSVPDGFGDQPRNFLVGATPGGMAGVDESDAGSRIVSGKKRSYTESTLTEQSLNSVESSRAVRTKKTVEPVPDDDDLLSSILVGRRSSVLKVKPTPPPSEITSLKRHRSAPRISTSKRKLLMDDTMVLHGDTIRQQLMNSEDIRRLRKKAPCTRPEIAMIQKQFLEDEVFRESIFSGVSIYLASLHNQTYDLSRITVFHDEVSGEKAENFSNKSNLCSSGQKVVVESAMDGGCELAAVRENVKIPTAENCELNDHKLGEYCDPSIDANTTEVQTRPTESLAVAVEPSSSQLEHPQKLAEIQIDGGSISIAGSVYRSFPVEVELSDCVSGDIGDISADRIQTASLDKRSEMDEPLVSSDETRELEFVEVDASVMDGAIGKVNENNEINDYNDDLVKVGDFIASVETEPTTRDGVSLEGIEGGATIETGREEYNANGPSTEIETDIDGRRFENIDQICDGIAGEQPIVNSSGPTENITLEASSLHEGEPPMQPESYLLNMFDTEISGIDMHDRNDLNYSAAANDTEFLNVDDDDVAEVTDDYTPNAEEIRFTENSGWSSRTRAVAKYLQTLFVKEPECRRKALPMDNLLDGKTRKEASRMFFEALVLKTRDYIHVEQECPFDNINIKPRTKLVKSDF